jgi:hypothetical protein
MRLLNALFGRGKNPAKAYVDAGMALTQRLVTSLNLPGWRDLEPTYSADQLEAIEGRLSGFQQMANDELGGEVKFHPEALHPYVERWRQRLLRSLLEARGNTAMRFPRTGLNVRPRT